MANSIRRHFGNLPDPRRAQGRRHALTDMIVIAVTAVICAADSWSDVLELTVGAIAAGGGCVGRVPDGRVVFVRHSLPGERVRARITSRTASAWARSSSSS